MSQKDIKKIIIRMPNWLGDLVMATPVLEDIRHHFPEAQITAMCKSSVAGMLQEDPNIDEIFSFHKSSGSGWIHRVQRHDIVDTIKHGEYDLGILLTNSFSSAWWFWRGGVKKRLGYSDHFRRPLLNMAVNYPDAKERQHLVKTYKMLLAPLDIPVSSTMPTLYITDQEKEHARQLLEKFGFKRGQKIIGINPGAAYGSAKCWLPERFQQVTRKLLENPDFQIVYFGDGAGTSLVNDICASLSDRVINMAGKTTLRELLALIDLCDVFLTNDSGPMHIAAALRTPLVALFGSTSDVKTGPYQWGKVIHKHVECSPCYKRVCPIDFRCMKRIESDEVYEAIIETLKTTHSMK